MISATEMCTALSVYVYFHIPLRKIRGFPQGNNTGFLKKVLSLYVLCVTVK